MDNDSTGNGGPLSFADTLTPLERAPLGLQADLSLFEVGKLTFPDNAKFQQSLVQTLIGNAKAGNLPVYGNPDGWLDWISTDASQPIGNTPLFPQCSAHLGSKNIVPPFVVSRNGETRIQARAIGAEQVKYSGDNCLASHADYFAFLKTPLARGIPKPDKWLPPTAESIPPLETSPPESPASAARPASVAKGGTVKTTREIALVVAENAALAALRKELKHEPTANQWLNYWKNGKDTEGTIKEVTRSEVVWTGKDNQIHRTALTTMNNRFSNAKKRNPFTPS
jgi:hypothetical protein